MSTELEKLREQNETLLDLTREAKEELTSMASRIQTGRARIMALGEELRTLTARYERLREAAAHAVEAYKHDYSPQERAAIDALRAALAEKEDKPDATTNHL